MGRPKGDRTLLVFSDRVIAARRMRGYETVRELAEGIEQRRDRFPFAPRFDTIKKMEAEESRPCDPRHLLDFARFLKVNPSFLTRETDDPGVGESRTQRVLDLLRAAYESKSFERTIGALNDAIRLCDAEPNDERLRVLRAKALAARAMEQTTGGARTKDWIAAIDRLAELNQGAIDSDVAYWHGTFAIDFAQDAMASATAKMRNGRLASAKVSLDAAIDATSDDHVRAILLARKSSVLRHQAGFHEQQSHLGSSAPTVWQRLDESVACADEALKHAESSITLLESGLARWFRARPERDDGKRVGLLREAERHLLASARANLAASQMSLTRFYRENDKAHDACEAFAMGLMSPDATSRSWLREAYLYGEVAISLWQRNRGDEDTNGHLRRAQDVLRRSIAAGYRHARIITALVHVTAILDGAESAKADGISFCVDSRGFDWSKVLKFVTSDVREETACAAFALGLDQSGVCNRLGTLFKDHLDDTALAREFYKAAVKLDPRNYRALKNLAELKYLLGEYTEALADAAKAASFAPPNFRWAAELQTEILKKLRVVAAIKPAEPR